MLLRVQNHDCASFYYQQLLQPTTTTTESPAVKQLALKEIEASSLNRQVTALTQRLDVVKVEVASNVGKLGEVRKLKVDAELTVEDLRVQVGELERQVAMWKGKSERLEVTVAGLRGDIVDLEAENEQLVRDLKDLGDAVGRVGVMARDDDD
jgi:chromosome segregation ATPase